jgi:hypothetical protein
LPCWFQLEILSITEILEEKYMAYNAEDVLEESPRYGRSWLPSSPYSISPLQGSFDFVDRLRKNVSIGL